MQKSPSKLTILPFCIIQVPLLVLVVIIFALSVALLNATIKSASIAGPQLVDGGVTLEGIYNGVIVLGAFQLFTAVCFLFCFNLINGPEWWLYVLFVDLMSFLLMVPYEAIFLKFTTCFYFVMARASLAIILACFLLLVPLLVTLYVFITGRSKDSSFLKRDLKLLVLPVVIIPAVAILAMNIVLINGLGPRLSQDIQPSTIYMGFFSTNEIASIQSGAYYKDANNATNFDQRLVGTLSQIISSADKQYAYRFEQIFFLFSNEDVLHTSFFNYIRPSLIRTKRTFFYNVDN